MAQDQSESTMAPIDYGSFNNQFPSDTMKSIGQFEKIYIKMSRQRMCTLFNETYINEESQPRYIYSKLYIEYIHIYIYIYIYIERERERERHIFTFIYTGKNRYSEYYLSIVELFRGFFFRQNI